MFARVMGVVSPIVFLVSSIVWGVSMGRPVAGVFAVAVGVAAALVSLWAWWRKGVGGFADSVSDIGWPEVAASVRGAWGKYWGVAAFTVGVYCVNMLLMFALKGSYRVGAYDVIMLWYIVDGLACSSWGELLRARAGQLAGERDER